MVEWDFWRNGTKRAVLNLGSPPAPRVHDTRASMVEFELFGYGVAAARQSGFRIFGGIEHNCMVNALFVFKTLQNF